MLKLALCILPLAGMTATAALMALPGNAQPDAGTIQSAYEAELGRGTKKHDPGLRIRTAECSMPDAARPDSFTCSVQFTTAADQDGRLYLDIVQVDRSDRGWKLKGGLCRS